MNKILWRTTKIFAVLSLTVVVGAGLATYAVSKEGIALLREQANAMNDAAPEAGNGPNFEKPQDGRQLSVGNPLDEATKVSNMK